MAKHKMVADDTCGCSGIKEEIEKLSRIVISLEKTVDDLVLDYKELKRHIKCKCDSPLAFYESDNKGGSTGNVKCTRCGLMVHRKDGKL